VPPIHHVQRVDIASPASPRPRLDEHRFERGETIKRLERLARLLDSAYRVPGTRIRFGLDPLLGLLPGVGDVASAALSAYLVYEARRLGVSSPMLARMIGNIGLDLMIGAVPLAGDVADVFWRANKRNMRLLRRHLDAESGR
jgi:Domain of unknown function (DUF4112)